MNVHQVRRIVHPQPGDVDRGERRALLAAPQGLRLAVAALVRMPLLRHLGEQSNFSRRFPALVRIHRPPGTGGAGWSPQ